MLNTAIEAAKEGAKLASKYFNNLPKVAWKEDESPVTKADVETEKVIRGYINRHYPDHGIHGEELPDKKSKSPYTWVIDPIDGTRDYIRGIPFWATYVAVLKNNEPIIGVIYLPILGDLITAEKGKGTFLNGKRVQVSKIKKLKEAYISHGQLRRFAHIGKEKQLIKLSKIIRATRSYGNFGLKMLLEGKIDAMIEAYGALHDFAATSIVVEEAGGNFTSLSGKKSLTEGTGLWTNGLIHKQVLDILNSK
jgi:histidinol-phosphatase